MVIKSTSQKITILFFIVFLSSCGGGGGSVPERAPEILTSQITGISALGPIAGGTVTAYDFSNGVKGDVIAVTTKPTDITGEYSLTVKSKTKAILVCSNGGSYLEAASTNLNKAGIDVGKKRVAFLSSEEICAVTNYQTGQDQKISISYFTNLAYALALYNIQNSVTVSTAVTNANQVINDWLGFDMVNTQPIDLTSESSGFSDLFDAKYKYGFANAAISSLLKTISLIGGSEAFQGINSKIFALRAFEDIKAEGLLNGKTNAIANEGLLKIGTQALTKIIYRERLADNLILFANSAENLSLLKASNGLVSLYASKISSYAGAVFETVPEFNSMPIAKDDAVEINIASSRVIKVLNNDIDSNPNDNLIAIIDKLPINGGSIILNQGNKTITYRVPDTAVASDIFKFSYFAYDGYVQSLMPATVTVNIVDRINIAPSAKSININTVADTTKNILINDLATDAEDNPLTIIIDSQPESYDPMTKLGSNVVIKSDSINFIAQRSTSSYIETFTYHVNDGLVDSNIATVTVNTSPAVNTAPIALVDFETIMKGVAEIKIDVLANDSDLDTLTSDLIIISASDPITGIGSIRYDQNFIYYTPPIRESIAVNETFNYIISDGSIISQPATVSLTFIPFDNPPVATGNTGGNGTGVAKIISTDTSNNTMKLEMLYNYFDEEGDLEDLTATKYRWFADGVIIPNETNRTIIVPLCTNGCSTSFGIEVTPVAKTGNLVGLPFLRCTACVVP